MKDRKMTDAEIHELVAGAAQVAVLWVGIDREIMLAALFDIRENMRAKLQRRLGADAADLTAQSFVATVVRLRDAIEAGTKGAPQ
jgi:hypothetical protein